MAKTVIEAFNIFLRDYVNLDPDETKSARNSRNWLLTQIHSFPSRDINFPKLFSDKDIFFGSFARRTKKRELDDVDIMIALNAEGGYYDEVGDSDIYITVDDSANRLKKLCYGDTNILNSRKVINKFIALLDKVPQYEEAQIKRNSEAATLKLKTYFWNFDIVPCFFTQEDFLGKTYYLIPDGNGNWKKTDPRIDRDRVSDINSFHNGNVLNLIRLLKYWNKRSTMPSMSSYLIENMILDYYSTNINSKASKYVDLEIPALLEYIKDNIFYPVNDPKEIQGDINTLKLEERRKISQRANLDYLKSLEARNWEEEDNYKQSINNWCQVFGENFPSYS